MYIPGETQNKESSKSITKPTTSTLYLSPKQENSGLQGVASKVSFPVELSKKHIKRLLVSVDNPHAENEAFLEKCSMFLKFLFQKQTRDFTEEPFQRLDSKILGKKLGKNQERTPHYYPYILTSLAQIGLLEVNHRYFGTQNGSGECKGYRVILQQPEHYEESDTGELFPGHDWEIDDPYHFSQLSKLKLDEQRFILLANLLPYDVKARSLFTFHNWTRKKHYVRLDTYGRVHTLLTQIDKRFRSCFSTHEGDAIFEVDVHACQPFLLLKITQEHLNFRKKEKLSISQLAEKHPEIRTYLTWIQGGRFYLELYKEFYGTRSNPKNGVKLIKFKKMLFRHIFFNDTPTKDKKVKIHGVFEQKFPIVSGAIRQKKKKEGFKSVSWDLQRLESKIMNAAIAQLKNFAPNEFFLRYHDAILTTERFSNQVKSVLESSLKDEIGVLGCVKSGHRWAHEFETTLKGLRLSTYFPYLKFKAEQHIKKTIAQEIKMKIGRMSKADRQLGVDGILAKWNTSPYYLERQEAIHRNFQFKGFYIPEHWTKEEVAHFVEKSKNELIQVFNHNLSIYDGSVRRMIDEIQKKILFHMENRLYKF